MRGEVINIGGRRARIVAVDEGCDTDTRFCDGDGGEIIIPAAPLITIPRLAEPHDREFADGALPRAVASVLETTIPRE